jgi:hypothetical protein
MLTLLLLAGSLLVPGARAADDDDDLFSTTPKEKKPEPTGSFSDDEEIEIPAYVPPPKEEPKARAASAPAGGELPIDLSGKAPLGDHFPATVAFVAPGAVVVDLPVVVATDAAGFDGVAYWLVVEASADGKKVAETRAQVTRDALAAGAPSVVWFRTFVPVAGESGLVELRVGKAASPAARPTPILTRSVPYAR